MEDQADKTTSTQTITFEGHGPGGFWAKITGGDLKSLFVVIIMLFCSGTLWVQADQNTTRFLAQHATTQGYQRDIIHQLTAMNALAKESQTKTERAQIIQTYVLTLNERERKDLQLTKPEELKRR